jgi:hypothetical protein
VKVKLRAGKRVDKRAGKKKVYALVLRQLNRRLGSVSGGMSARIQSLSVSQVEMLGEALLDFTDTADLEEWMRSQNID